MILFAKETKQCYKITLKQHASINGLLFKRHFQTELLRIRVTQSPLRQLLNIQ